MPATKVYRYSSIDAAGHRAKGTVEAPNEAAAGNLLKQRGETPLELTEAGKGLDMEIKIPGLGNRVKLKDLAVFARQFATMTASGMSLLRSLAILEEQSSSPSALFSGGEVDCSSRIASDRSSDMPEAVIVAN